MKGDADSNSKPYNSGDLDYNNVGVSFYGMSDYKNAVEWFTKSAEMNDARAQYNLAFCYENGKGVDVDVKKPQNFLQNQPSMAIRRHSVSSVTVMK